MSGGRAVAQRSGGWVSQVGTVGYIRAVCCCPCVRVCNVMLHFPRNGEDRAGTGDSGGQGGRGRVAPAVNGMLFGNEGSLLRYEYVGVVGK